MVGLHVHACNVMVNLKLTSRYSYVVNNSHPCGASSDSPNKTSTRKNDSMEHVVTYIEVSLLQNRCTAQMTPHSTAVNSAIIITPHTTTIVVAW